MRVLHCMPTMAGGGSERQLALLAEGQTHAGLGVFVALLRSGPNLARLKESGAQVIFLRAHGNYDPRVIFQIAGIIREHRIDLVQTWLPQMDVFGALAARWVGVPYIVSERSCLLAYPRSVKHALRVTIGRSANAVVANSLGGLHYWYGKNNSQLSRVIRNVVSIAEVGMLDPGTKETNCRPGSRLLYAGRYTSSKNLADLLKALALVLPRFPGAVAEFHGDGPLKGDLLRARDQLGLASRVSIGGYLDPLIPKLKETTVFVSPSSFEGNPNTVIEAAACGCTLVVSDIPAHREFLDDACAYFVDFNSPTDIARGIERALSDSEDVQRKRGMAARDRVSSWTAEAITSEYIDLYKDVLKEHWGTTSPGS